MSTQISELGRDERRNLVGRHTRSRKAPVSGVPIILESLSPAISVDWKYF